MYITSCILLFYSTSNLVLVSSQFVLPDVHVSALSPKGFRACISDQKGLEMFSFHGNVNKPLPELNNGDFWAEIEEKSGDRWCFLDTQKQLMIGDKINYWVYVQFNQMGYRKEDQTYTVTGYIDQRSPLEFETTTLAPPDSSPHSAKVYVRDDAPCAEGLFASDIPEEKKFEVLVCQVQENVQYMKSLKRSFNRLRDQLQFLDHINTALLKRLEVPDVKKRNALLLSGNVPRTVSPMHMVIDVIRDKVGMPTKYFSVVKAVRRNDGTVMFEVETFVQKMKILLRSKSRLLNTKYTIDDVEDNYDGVDSSTLLSNN